MNGPSRKNGPTAARVQWTRVLVLLATAYVLAYGFAFAGDALARSPVLDARENLAWAERIAAGDLPDEPLYRALLYPWVLSWFAGTNLPTVALLLGLLSHGAGAALAGGLARVVWNSHKAALLTGLLYAVYPVALFFSGQGLDISFATTLFLAGLWFLVSAGQPDRGAAGSMSRWFAAGLCVGLAVLARPNFLPPALLFPILGGIQAGVRGWGAPRALRSGAVIALPLAGLLLAQGMLNERLSGEFRILPWQGAYNLYAANREGANGKYYVQQMRFDKIAEGRNTARMESEYLYRRETGAAPADVGAMNAYWRTRFMERLTEDPSGWLGLMGRKVVYLFNDWEPYNNLTYAFHKERFPLLRWNPLGWGILLLGGALGVVAGFRRGSKVDLFALACAGGAYTTGLLLFYVSARFRLPLAPLLCVACGGLVFVAWQQLTMRKILLVAGILAVGAFGVYGNWFDARNRESFKQDNLLVANAALRVGEDEKAATYAERAVELDPGMEAAKRVLVSAYFNQWLGMEGAEARRIWERLSENIARIEQHDASTRFIQGFVRWRSGETTEARRIWRNAVERYGQEAGSSAAALEWVDARSSDSVSEAAERMRFLFERIP
ncbi:MAG: hypothetical protein ACLFO5_07090 [Opitutales bacterium]